MYNNTRKIEIEIETETRIQDTRINQEDKRQEQEPKLLYAEHRTMRIEPSCHKLEIEKYFEL